MGQFATCFDGGFEAGSGVDAVGASSGGLGEWAEGGELCMSGLVER